MPTQPVYQFKIDLSEAMGLVAGKPSLSDVLNNMFQRGYFLSGMALLRLKKPTLYVIVSQMFDPTEDESLPVETSKDLGEGEVV